ncbi:sensor domain-containing protein [Actinoplanes aureus]|uniref:Sensor domain-containing protein n=1 Tax=Actinoplanes aureus TaxID=2792083 RepID=A0A931FWC6_9ACTN|nr:sensor domain-containing protein [Actinoplanes aureus]MBG0561210.1 sensor domain-containing protein [Actinoplanes aureus]
MFVTARTRRAVRTRAALAAACALVMAAAGCGSDEPDPAPDAGLIGVTTMRGAFLQAAEIGPTWSAPGQSSDPQQMVSFCGGTSAPPQVPPGAEVVSSSIADEGTKGAQTLHQAALVYPDAAAAAAGQALLRAVADKCQPSVTVPATVTADRNEPAYTETVEVRPLDEGAWSGFVIIRHKLYEAAHPGTADTAVAVLNSRNVVLVDTYAVYRLNNASASPGFETDWQRLVGSVVQRVG